jgi:hypothetical protein
MKNTTFYFCLLVILIINQTHAQFSGEIVYAFEYQTQNNQPIKDVVSMPIIDSVSYSIHKEAYKSVSYSQGEIVEEYIYDSTTKKMLFSMGNRPYYLYLQTDLEKFKSDSKIKIFKKNKEEILGYSTYQSLNSSGGEINYYSDEIQIDASAFSEHYFMNWNQVLKQTNGGIPLKTITSHNGYTEIKTAIKVEKRSAEEMNFKIDSTKIQVAAYNNLDEVIEFPVLKGRGFWCYQAVVEKYSNRLIDGKDYQLVLRFVIHPDASITHVEVEESNYEYLNEAAKEIIETCDLGFDPGLMNGIPVSSEIYYPINF